MAKTSLIITIMVAVIVGSLGFFGGMQYQKNKRVSLLENPPRGFQVGTRQGNINGMGRPVSGEISAMDGDTITVKTQDGGSKIVIYSASTKINKTTEGSVSDLKVGDQVMAIGSEGTNGTLTAQTISTGTIAPRGN